MRTRGALAVWLALAGCGPAGAGAETSSGDTGWSTGAAAPTEAGSGEGTSTGDPTGEPPQDACDPALAPIAEDEFAERFAAAICAQKAACGCATGSACEAPFTAEFAEVREHARASGLTYDGVCAARKLIGLIERRGCEMASKIEFRPACADECTMYRGDIAPGHECPALVKLNAFLLTRFIDDCAAPGACDYEYKLVCTSPLPVVGEGEACRDDSANEIAACSPGLYCNFKARACVPATKPGEPCLDLDCTSPQFCSQAELCTAPGEPGASCTSPGQCTTGRCGAAGCEDWRWICEIAEAADLFTRNPAAF